MSKKLINKLLLAHIEHLNVDIKTSKEWADRQFNEIRALEEQVKYLERDARDTYEAQHTQPRKYATLDQLKFIMDPNNLAEKKILSIKAVMDATNTRLKEAKDFVEAMIALHGSVAEPN